MAHLIAFRCVCDVAIVPSIASTAGNKLPWRNWHDKINYYSHYSLRNWAFVLFKVTANSKYRLWALIIKIRASAKLAVKYRLDRWNTGHLATLARAKHSFTHSSISNTTWVPSWFSSFCCVLFSIVSGPQPADIFGGQSDCDLLLLLLWRGVTMWINSLEFVNVLFLKVMQLSKPICEALFLRCFERYELVRTTARAL